MERGVAVEAAEPDANGDGERNDSWKFINDDRLDNSLDTVLERKVAFLFA